jgi:hypothetical protein
LLQQGFDEENRVDGGVDQHWNIQSSYVI